MATIKRLFSNFSYAFLMQAFLACILIIGGTAYVFSDAPHPEVDVPYEPTNPRVVEAILKLGGACPNDIHFDLGCGDGRIVIMAAKKFKVKQAYGIDLDPQRLREAEEKAEAYGLSDKTTFIHKNIFEADISQANLVTMYLLNHINLKMRPLLFAQLQPGSRIVTHAFHMDDWEPDKIVRHPYARDQKIHLWIIPAPLGGEWEWTTATKAGNIASKLKLGQAFQYVAGTITYGGDEKKIAIRNPLVDGVAFSFTAKAAVNGKAVSVKYQGIAKGDSINGTQAWSGADFTGTYPWNARRKSVNVLGRWNIDIPQKAMYSGVLNLRKEGATKLVASFYSKSGNSELRIHDVYLWGTNVYFRLPLSYTEYVLFKGELNNDAGAGTVYGKRVSSDYQEEGKDSVLWTADWTAARVK